MHRVLIALLTVLLGYSDAFAQSGEASESSQASQASEPTLAELARQADLIAVVRVQSTEYSKTRSFPSAGYAFLEVLIAYKGSQRGTVIEVREKGLGDHTCYYPELGTWQFEGDRFLVFLNRAQGKDVYRGRAPGCRLPVLVTRDNQYALLQPIAGIRLDRTDLLRELDYSDPAAFVDAADFTSAGIGELENFYRARRVVSADPLAPPDLRFVYTLGIPISSLRELLALGAASPE